MHYTPLTAAVLLFLVATGYGHVTAQSERPEARGYQPTYEDPSGTQLVAVYLSASTCAPCRGPQMPALIDSVKLQLQRQAKARGQQFRAVFVGMDWEPDSALALAKEDGLWDELDVGWDWFNVGAEQYIWGNAATTPGLPQIIVFQQKITTGKGRPAFGPRRVLLHVLGPVALKEWVDRGSPLP